MPDTWKRVKEKRIRFSLDSDWEIESVIPDAGRVRFIRKVKLTQAINAIRLRFEIPKMYKISH